MARIQKCLIENCPRIICPRCQHWYSTQKPDEVKAHKTCVERAANRHKLPTCPCCRQSMFGYWGDASIAECDERDKYVQMQHNRFLYRGEHIGEYRRRKLKRPEKQVRTLRATSNAPTTK